MLYDELKNDPNLNLVLWCNICSSEQATTAIKAEINGDWIDLDVGSECLTSLLRDGKLDV